MFPDGIEKDRDSARSSGRNSAIWSDPQLEFAFDMLEANATIAQPVPYDDSVSTLAPEDRRSRVNEDELVELLRERQNNGRIGYLTFGDLVAMVPSDQMDEWRAVLAKVRAADTARDAKEDTE